jgi:hypothetical protein
MADYTRMWGFGDFRGIERIVRNSTIKVGIFSLDPNIGDLFLSQPDLTIKKSCLANHEYPLMIYPTLQAVCR